MTASNEAAVAAFTSKRDVAVLRERVEVDKRLGLLNLCEMMSGLQEVLESFLATSDGKIESQAEEITRIVLGDAADKLSLDSAFHQKLARSFYARLCALLVPAHNRIAALFRGAGKCQSGAIAQYHTKADAKDKIQAQHYQEALKRPHIAMGSGESDIYDVQLIDGADVGAWKAYGYQVVGTELNADLCDTERGIGILNSCKPDTPPKKEDSRRFVYLLRRAIFDPNGALQRRTVAAAGAAVLFLRSLSSPPPRYPYPPPHFVPRRHDPDDARQLQQHRGPEGQGLFPHCRRLPGAHL